MAGNLFLFALGLVLLVAGAEALVRGASRLATSIGISPLVVGLTVVAFGTSAPELVVSVGAVLDGTADIAVGNVVGSNIFNVLFILGLSALVTPLVVDAQVIRQEVPVMIGATLLLLPLLLDRTLARGEAMLLLAALIAYTAFLVVQARRASGATQAEFAGAAAPRAGGGWDRYPAVQVLLVAAGLGLLVLGARQVVGAAIALAQAMGVSELVIGLTIVAAGTSLPEVATSVLAAARGQRDIAVGNVVGSCTFNILGCLGAAGVASSGGLPVAGAVMTFDAWVMLAVALACLPVFATGREIARWEGMLFLGYYVAYTSYVLLAASQHDALPAFSAAMLSFVIPLTVVTLVVVTVRSSTARGEAG